jgi:ferric-dicitrate binding protein FerR (iron transport regulator)
MFKQISMALLSTFLVAGSFAVAPVSYGAGASATVTHVLGTVQVRTRAGWRGTFSNVKLWPGMSLRTGRNSRTQIRYDDGSVVRLGSNSLMRVQPSRSVRLLRGKSWLKKTKNDQRFQVRTPMAQATVLGTELFVAHSEERNASHVTTLTGLVEVESNKGETVMVKAGQWVEIEPDKALEQPTPFDWNELKKKERLLLDMDFKPAPDAPEDPDEDWM